MSKPHSGPIEPLLTTLLMRCGRLLDRLDQRQTVLVEMRALGDEIDHAYARFEASARSVNDAHLLNLVQTNSQARIELLRQQAAAVLDEWWAIHHDVEAAFIEGAKRNPLFLQASKRFRELPMPSSSSSSLQLLELQNLLRSVLEPPTPTEQERKPDEDGGSLTRKGLLTAQEVAAVLGISDKTVYRFVKEGRIPYVRLQSNLRFRRSDIDRWLEERSFQPKKTAKKP